MNEGHGFVCVFVLSSESIHDARLVGTSVVSVTVRRSVVSVRHSVVCPFRRPYPSLVSVIPLSLSVMSFRRLCPLFRHLKWFRRYSPSRLSDASIRHVCPLRLSAASVRLPSERPSSNSVHPSGQASAIAGNVLVYIFYHGSMHVLFPPLPCRARVLCLLVIWRYRL